jgi:inner membrane protein
MDNLTHTLFGVAMARAGLAKNRPWAVALLAVSANGPDLDSLIPPASTAQYLLHHRGISHSLPGLVMEALFLGAVWFAWLRRRPSSKVSPPPRFLEMFGLALAGTVSHLALDWLNTYGVRPFLPFSDAVYYGDVTFIVDPWFWLLLWAGCYLTAPYTRAARWVWGGLFSFMVTILAWGTSRGLLPPAACAIFVVLGLGTLIVRAMMSRRAARAESSTSAPPLRPARWALALVAVYLSGLFCISRIAQLRVREQDPKLSGAHFSSHPEPGVPWRYTVLADSGATIARFEVDVLRGIVARGAGFETHRDDPALAAVRETPEYRAWRFFARHPVVDRDATGLTLGDARYRLWPRPDWTAMHVKTP